MINPLAAELNATIKLNNEPVYNMLSKIGREIFFPKVGILSQSAEAKQQAHRFNATIGIAVENGEAMHLNVIRDTLPEYSVSEIFDYAPPAGNPQLRKIWKELMVQKNPSLAGVPLGDPIVVNALTHGSAIAADLFVERGDVIVSPDKYWENYDLIYAIRREAEIVTFPLFTEEMRFNSNGLRDTLLAQKDKGKAILILNFPNNPTGYTPSVSEADEITRAIVTAADAGIDIVVICDDAYFGLFYEEDSLQESIFTKLVGVHPHVMAIKLDGVTKEEYAWGLRVGFITYGGFSPAVLEALEQKTMGIIRGGISNSPNPSQSFVLHGFRSPDYAAQKAEKFATLKARANRTKQVLTSGRYDPEVLSYYPFNSGYFMTLKLPVNAEKVRVQLLTHYGIGTIALGEHDLRVAFSSVELADIEPLFDAAYQATLDVIQAEQEQVKQSAQHASAKS